MYGKQRGPVLSDNWFRNHPGARAFPWFSKADREDAEERQRERDKAHPRYRMDGTVRDES